MALLVGILIALGRLSGDREIVAMEACGVSLGRLLRPLLLFGARRDGRDDLRHDRRAACRKSSVPRDHVQAADDARRNQDQAACVLHGISEPRHLRARSDAGRRLDRRDGVRQQHADAAEDLSRQERAPAARRSRSARCRWCCSTARITRSISTSPRNISTARSRRRRSSSIPRPCFPATGPMKGLTEMTIAELKKEMAELREAEHLPAQPDHGVAEEVLDSGGLPRLHARGARAWASATGATAGSRASCSASASCSCTGF